jgi:hypothetical protein
MAEITMIIIPIILIHWTAAIPIFKGVSLSLIKFYVILPDLANENIGNNDLL